MSISSKQVFTTADGRQFDTRKEAEAHEVVAARIVKVKAVVGESATAEVIEFIAKNGDALIVALSNPLNRGRKAKAPAEAPAA